RATGFAARRPRGRGRRLRSRHATLPRRPRHPPRRAGRATPPDHPRPATRRPARPAPAGRGGSRPRPRRRTGARPMTTELNPNATAPARKPRPTRKRALLAIAAVAILALLAWALWYVFVGRWHEGTDDAYVQGNVVAVTPQVAGTVVAINAEDGMKVQAGQVLVQLDPNDAQVALAQAEADLAATVRQVRGLYAAVDAGEAALRARRAAVDKARADVARRAGLVRTGAVSREELAHARNELAAAEAALAATREDLGRSQALVDDTEVATQPQVRAAAARVRAAYLAGQRAGIVAPVTGYVAQRSVQLGQRVQPGTTLMAVIPLQQAWVEANFKETQLAKMRLGQPVELTSDLYG